VLSPSTAFTSPITYAESGMFLGASPADDTLFSATDKMGITIGLPTWNCSNISATNQSITSLPFLSKDYGSMDAVTIGSYVPQHNLILDNPASTSHAIVDTTSQINIPEIQAIRKAVSRFMTRPLSSTSPRPLPSIHLNTLQCPLTRTLTAYIHNALSLHLTLPFLLRTHQSPFHIPSIPPSSSPTHLLISSRKPHIPPHLQPTLPQILYPHHPYIDLIPIPRLRENIIMLGMIGGSFNPMELKMDIFREGLFCSKGEAWDGRGWEVAPWFVEKWRLLFG